MSIRPELIDELLQDYQNPQDLLGEAGILKQLTKALVERCLETEMDTHLNGIKQVQPTGNGKGDRRNGHSRKTMMRRIWGSNN